MYKNIVSSNTSLSSIITSKLKIYFPWVTLKAAFFKSAFSSIITGHLPPNSKIHGVRFLAADWATSFPFSVDPVKKI